MILVGFFGTKIRCFLNLTRLAVRLVDYLVAKSGCDALRQATVAAILERPKKWEVLRALDIGNHNFHRKMFAQFENIGKIFP